MATLALGQHLAQERQHRRIGEVKHHSTDKENNQGSILEQRADANGLSNLAALPRPAGEFVVNLLGLNSAEGEEGRERTRRHEKEDAAIGE